MTIAKQHQRSRAAVIPAADGTYLAYLSIGSPVDGSVQCHAGWATVSAAYDWCARQVVAASAPPETPTVQSDKPDR